MTPPLAPPPYARLGSISALASVQLCVRLQACSLFCGCGCGLGGVHHTHTNTHFLVYINRVVCLCVCACVCMSVRVSACLCASLLVCVCVSLCMCLHVCVCVCVRVSCPGFSPDNIGLNSHQGAVLSWISEAHAHGDEHVATIRSWNLV